MPNVNEWGDEEAAAPTAVMDAPAAAAPAAPTNTWGDPESQATVATADANGNLPTNNWGDPVSADVVVRPAAGPVQIRDPRAGQENDISAVSGRSAAQAQRRGEAGAQALAQASGEVAAPVLRVGGPMAGVALAPFTGGSSIVAGVALGTLGAALAEPVAQAAEKLAGTRDAYSLDEAKLNVALGGPLAGLGPLAKGIMPWATRAGLSTTAKVISTGLHATEGAAINAGQGAILRSAHAQGQDLHDIAGDVILGGLTGGVLGTAFDTLARARNLETAVQAARQMGYAGPAAESNLKAWAKVNADQLEKLGRAWRYKNSMDVEATPAGETPAATAEAPSQQEQWRREINQQLEQGRQTTAEAASPKSGPLLSADEITQTARRMRGISVDELKDASSGKYTSKQLSDKLNEIGDEIDRIRGAGGTSADIATLQDRAGIYKNLVMRQSNREIVAKPPAVDLATWRATERSARVGGLAQLHDSQLEQLSRQLGVNTPVRAADAPALPAPQPNEFGDLPAAPEGTVVDVPPEAPKGKRPGFGARLDGNMDLLDDIQQLGGIPKPPTDAVGRGEWNGWNETFGDAKTRLLVNPQGKGGIDTYIQSLNNTGRYNFATSQDFYDAVPVAIEARKRADAVHQQQIEHGKFYAAALENKGRGPGEAADEPIPTDSLNAGATFRIKGEPVTVKEVTEDGRVIVQDGDRFGTQELPPGVNLHPDAGSVKHAEPTANEWGDVPAEDSATNSAAAMPDPVAAATVPRTAATLAEARTAAQSLVGTPLENQSTGMVATLSKTSLEKMLSHSAVKKSATANAHAQAVANIDHLFKTAQIAETNPDRAGDINIKNVHRFASVMMHNGQPLGVKITVKELANPTGNRIYTVEAIDLQNAKPAGQLADGKGANLPPERAAPLTGFDKTVRHLIDNVKTAQAKPAGGDLFSTEDTPFNLAGEEGKDFTGHMDAEAQRRADRAAADKAQGDMFGGRSSNAEGSPGAEGANAYPGPEAFTAQPVDDPTFTQLPAELPEAVQLYRSLTDGQYPKIREHMRLLGGNALGVFRHTDATGEFSIELRADIFNLVSQAEKRRLMNEAVLWARAQQAYEPNMNVKQAVAGRFNELVRAAEKKALTENPKQALAVIWHEIGHLVDWLPHQTLKRGNFIGHIAALKNHLKSFIADHPGMNPVPVPPTATEKARLHRQAEKELRGSIREIVETIKREEPVYRELPITADHITSILKNAQREDFPQLYDWFAKLERADKAAVLRAAMKGIVDERAAKFGKREATGETRTVEETRMRTEGVAGGTPEEIRKRYEELLREELKRRGLVSERDIRAEAAEVIKWWQGVPEVPEYFKTATETYAEVFSAWMNNPAGVAKRAPNLFKLLNAYMVERPAIAKLYEEMQDSIRSGAIHRERVLNLRDMFHRDEEASILADSMIHRPTWRNVLDMVNVLFNRKTGPIQYRALSLLRKDPGSRVAIDVLTALKNHLYHASGWESFARQVNRNVESYLAENNLNHDDLAEFMFHSRIASGDRQQLANPLGWSPKTSAERLQALAADLGPERANALRIAAADFRAIYETEVIPLLKQSGMLTPELLQIIEDRTLYATFSKAREFNPLESGTIEGLLENSYGKDVTARIYRQIGSLGEIRSPYLATIQKAFSLIATSRRQIALKSIVSFIQETEPHNIMPARERFVSGHWEPVPMETRQVGTLYTVNAGKVEAFYVPRVYAEMMSNGAPMEAQILAGVHKVLAWPKAILTELNPGFWPAAFFKDVWTVAVQLPGGMGALKHIPSSYLAARASMDRKRHILASHQANREAQWAADLALRRSMLISRTDNRGEHLGHGDEVTRILMRMGQSPQLMNAEAKKIGLALRAWMAWKGQGQVFERTIKIAGMQHLDEAFPKMPEWEKQRIVLERAGSPDFLEKGRWASLADLMVFFYNPWLRGLESLKDSAKANPTGFWTKFLGTVGVAATAYYFFEKGETNLGINPDTAEDLRDQLRSIPERDKRRGFVLPLGWADKEQGKVAYLLLPFPDSLRYLHTGLRSMLQITHKDKTAGEGFQSFVNYQGQDLPGGNPVWTELMKNWDYHIKGINPYDDFRGRPVLSDKMMTAGEGGSELALQTVSNLTGGIIYRRQQDHPGDTPTGLEKFLQTPAVANLLGRWVRVSNRGLEEETQSVLQPVRQHEAQLQLIGDDMVARQLRGDAWTPAQETLYTEEPTLANYIISHQLKIMKTATDPEMKAWGEAKTMEEKAALLDMWNKRAAAKESRLKK